MSWRVQDYAGGPEVAIIVAGGTGRRLGGADKPGMVIGDRTLLDVALTAVAPARTTVVGPVRSLPGGVRNTRESPAGGGPAAAVAAGFAHASPDSEELVAVLAADLPGVTRSMVVQLAAQLRRLDVDGVVAVDESGRHQLLLGVWRARALAGALADRPDWHNARLADLLEPLIGATLPATAAEVEDIDTPEDLRRWV